MTRTPTAPDPGTQAPDPAGRGPSVFADVLAALGELDVAQEELHVADEALREYEQQLAELVDRHQEQQRSRERIATLVPVCQLVTDLSGTVLEADPATERLLSTPAERLTGKPLAVDVAPDRRGPLRAALSALGTGSPEVRVVLPVLARGGEGTVVDAVGVLERAVPRDRVRWVWLPAALSGRAPGAGDEGDLVVAGAVARLCSVPVGTGTSRWCWVSCP